MIIRVTPLPKIGAAGSGLAIYDWLVTQKPKEIVVVPFQKGQGIALEKISCEIKYAPFDVYRGKKWVRYIKMILFNIYISAIVVNRGGDGVFLHSMYFWYSGLMFGLFKAIPVAFLVHGSDAKILHRWSFRAYRKLAKPKIFIIGSPPSPTSENINDIISVKNRSITYDDLRDKPKSRRVVYVGRSEDVKNFNLVCRLIRLCCGLNIEVAFDIVGVADNDVPDDVKRIVNVEVHGKISHYNCASIIAGAEFILIPSWSEGIPKVMLEALYYKTIPILSRQIAVKFFSDKSMLQTLAFDAASENEALSTLRMFLAGHIDVGKYRDQIATPGSVGIWSALNSLALGSSSTVEGV